MMLKNFGQMEQFVREQSGKKRVALAAAHDADALGSLMMAVDRGIAAAILIGRREEIVQVLDEMGKDAGDFRIIEEEPERLAEIKGISEKKAREIAAQLEEKKDMRKAMMFLQQYGVSNNMAVKLYGKYGDEIYRVLQENPYRLADEVNGIGFRAADEIARRAGIAADSDFRIRSAITYMLLLLIFIQFLMEK